jgi:thiosulfate dehydrogenase [quinone] large subunit
MGLIFLWAFFDKLLGLGFATKAENAWINGGSPTSGFLLHGTKGPFAEFFQSLAGIPTVDWLFMV